MLRPNYDRGDEVKCTETLCGHFKEGSVWTCDGFEMYILFGVIYACEICSEPLYQLALMAGGNHPVCPYHFTKWPPPGSQTELERSYEVVFS